MVNESVENVSLPKGRWNSKVIDQSSRIEMWFPCCDRRLKIGRKPKKFISPWRLWFIVLTAKNPNNWMFSDNFFQMELLKTVQNSVCFQILTLTSKVICIKGRFLLLIAFSSACSSLVSYVPMRNSRRIRDKIFQSPPTILFLDWTCCILRWCLISFFPINVYLKNRYAETSFSWV